MSLLSLPLEILDQIIDLTLPASIENFALCCKTIHTRAATQIQRHNHLKAEWNNVVLTNRNIIYTLHEILCDPLIAQYIVEPNFWQEDDDSAQTDRFHLDEAAVEKVKRSVVDSYVLKKAGVNGQDWWEEIEKETQMEDGIHEDYIRSAITILSRLPNLRRLQLWPGWSDLRTQYEDGDGGQDMLLVLNTVVEIANDASSDNTPLARLTRIMPFMRPGYEERAGLQALLPFLILKNLQSLYAVSCVAVDDGYTGIPFKWHFQSQTSPLRRIELAHCCIDADGLSELVSHTPQLEMFRYSHETKWHGCQHDWNPGAFVEVLARHCSKTITHLGLTIDNIYGEIENGASTFLSFRKVEYLEVDAIIFRGPPLESGQSKGLAGRIPEGHTPWTEDDIPCIGSMLPDQVVEVHVNCDYPTPDETALHKLLKNLVQQRRDRLFKLERVVIRGDEAAREVTENVGATLEVYDLELAGNEPHMRPEWKRTFDERIGGITFS